MLIKLVIWVSDLGLRVGTEKLPVQNQNLAASDSNSWFTLVLHGTAMEAMEALEAVQQGIAKKVQHRPAEEAAQNSTVATGNTERYDRV